jgi:hypothetical protein
MEQEKMRLAVEQMNRCLTAFSKDFLKEQSKAFANLSKALEPVVAEIRELNKKLGANS